MNQSREHDEFWSQHVSGAHQEAGHAEAEGTERVAPRVLAALLPVLAERAARHGWGVTRAVVRRESAPIHSTPQRLSECRLSECTKSLRKVLLRPGGERADAHLRHSNMKYASSSSDTYVLPFLRMAASINAHSTMAFIISPNCAPPQGRRQLPSNRVRA